MLPTLAAITITVAAGVAKLRPPSPAAIATRFSTSLFEVAKVRPRYNLNLDLNFIGANFGRLPTGARNRPGGRGGSGSGPQMALAFGARELRAPFFFSSSFFPPGRLFARR